MMQHYDTCLICGAVVITSGENAGRFLHEDWHAKQDFIQRQIAEHLELEIP